MPAKKLCIATVGTDLSGNVFPIRCKRWDCEICAPINAYHHAIRVANGCQALVTAGIRPYFLTITQPGSVRTPKRAYEILHNQWDKFRNRWQYWSRTHNSVPTWYAAFVEGQPHRDDMPHFHIIATYLPPIEELREMVVASGLGYQLDVQTFTTASGVAWYVSKYSTKATDAAIMPKGFRRTRYSEQFPKMKFRVDETAGNAIVKIFRESYQEWLDRAARKGVKIEVIEKNLFALLEQAPLDVETRIVA